MRRARTDRDFSPAPCRRHRGSNCCRDRRRGTAPPAWRRRSGRTPCFMSFGVSLGGLTSLCWVFGENITSTVTPLPRLIGLVIEPSLFLWVKLRSVGDCNFFSSAAGGVDIGLQRVPVVHIALGDFRRIRSPVRCWFACTARWRSSWSTPTAPLRARRSRSGPGTCCAEYRPCRECGRSRSRPPPSARRGWPNRHPRSPSSSFGSTDCSLPRITLRLSGLACRRFSSPLRIVELVERAMNNAAALVGAIEQRGHAFR